MITCLGFVFFDRHRSKERGQFFGKFFGKIDEIRVCVLVTAGHEANQLPQKNKSF